MVNNRVEEVGAKYLVGQHSLESGIDEGNREANSVPVGYKQTEVGVIPEDWVVATLGSIGKFKNGINKSAEDFGFGAPFVNLMDVFGKPSIKSAEHLGLINSTDLDKKEYSLFSGDVLFIRSSVKPSGVGLTTVLLSDLRGTVFSGFLIRFRSEARLSNEFKRYCFYEDGFRSRIISGSTVSANTNINQDVLKEILLIFPPSLEEQATIANALSDVDALISNLESLIAKKQAIKTATMQQLLTGRTRLPEFALWGDGLPKGYRQSELGEVPEDWEVLDFGDLLKEFRNGYAFSASGYVQTGTPIITMAQIGLSGSFQFDSSKVNKWDSYQQDSLRDFWVRNGDLLIAMTDVTPEKNLIGQMTIAKLDRIALLNQRVGLLRLKPDIANSVYLGFLSCLPIWKKYCKGVASLGVQANIGTSDIRSAKVPVPSVKEQAAIATILSDMDKEIQTLEQRLNKTRQIKQGMMQQLLTGKIRLVKPETDAQ